MPLRFLNVNWARAPATPCRRTASRHPRARFPASPPDMAGGRTKKWANFAKPHIFGTDSKNRPALRPGRNWRNDWRCDATRRFDTTRSRQEICGSPPLSSCDQRLSDARRPHDNGGERRAFRRHRRRHAGRRHPFLSPHHHRALKNMAKSEQPIVIKKYANRRLYNTGTSTYVTLEDLA